MKKIFVFSTVAFILLSVMLLYHLLSDNNKLHKKNKKEPIAKAPVFIDTINYPICCFRNGFYLGIKYHEFDSIFKREANILDSYEKNIRYRSIYDTIYIDSKNEFYIKYFFIFSFDRLTSFNVHYTSQIKLFPIMLKYINIKCFNPCYNIEFKEKLYEFKKDNYNYSIEESKIIDSSKYITCWIYSRKIDSLIKLTNK